MGILVPLLSLVQVPVLGLVLVLQLVLVLLLVIVLVANRLSPFSAPPTLFGGVHRRK